MTTVYVLSAAEDVLAAVGDDKREAIAADLEHLDSANGVHLTIENKEYEAAELVDGWVAVYRRLAPGELGAIPGENAIAVFDLVRPDTVEATSERNTVTA